jgi:hypothetical protein
VELHFRDIAERKVLYTFGDGREDLGWWLVEQWWILVVGLHLDADVDWFFSVASSGLSSGLEHSGRQILGSDN